jgi:hypothetical protein
VRELHSERFSTHFFLTIVSISSCTIASVNVCDLIESASGHFKLHLRAIRWEKKVVSGIHAIEREIEKHNQNLESRIACESDALFQM